VVYGPHDAPLPSAPDIPARDPLWDLPIEDLPVPDPDTVTPGEALPAGYEFTSNSRAIVSFLLGRLISHSPFVFP